MIDIKYYPLPFYDGAPEVLNNYYVKELDKLFNKSDEIIISSPVYNYDINAVFKNFIDFLSVIQHKNIVKTKQVIGFIGRYVQITMSTLLVVV